MTFATNGRQYVIILSSPCLVPIERLYRVNGRFMCSTSAYIDQWSV